MGRINYTHLSDQDLFNGDRTYYSLCGEIILTPVGGVCTAMENFMSLENLHAGTKPTTKLCAECCREAEESAQHP